MKTRLLLGDLGVPIQFKSPDTQFNSIDDSKSSSNLVRKMFTKAQMTARGCSVQFQFQFIEFQRIEIRENFVRDRLRSEGDVKSIRLLGGLQFWSLIKLKLKPVLFRIDRWNLWNFNRVSWSMVWIIWKSFLLDTLIFKLWMKKNVLAYDDDLAKRELLFSLMIVSICHHFSAPSFKKFKAFSKSTSRKLWSKLIALDKDKICMLLSQWN